MSAVQAYQGQGSRRHPGWRESRSCMPTGSSTSTSPGTPLPPSPSRPSRPRVSSPQYRLPDPGADRELARTARLPGAHAHGHARRQRRHPPRTQDASSRPARRRAAPALPQEGSPSPQESSASSGEPPASSAASPRSTTAASFDVRNVVWGTGFRPDFSWIRVAFETDADGYPVQYRGAAASSPGLYAGRVRAGNRVVIEHLLVWSGRVISIPSPCRRRVTELSQQPSTRPQAPDEAAVSPASRKVELEGRHARRSRSSPRRPWPPGVDGNRSSVARSHH